MVSSANSFDKYPYSIGYFSITIKLTSSVKPSLLAEDNDKGRFAKFCFVGIPMIGKGQILLMLLIYLDNKIHIHSTIPYCKDRNQQFLEEKHFSKTYQLQLSVTEEKRSLFSLQSPSLEISEAKHPFLRRSTPKFSSRHKNSLDIFSRFPSEFCRYVTTRLNFTWNVFCSRSNIFSIVFFETETWKSSKFCQLGQHLSYIGFLFDHIGL